MMRAEETTQDNILFSFLSNVKSKDKSAQMTGLNTSPKTSVKTPKAILSAQNNAITRLYDISFLSSAFILTPQNDLHNIITYFKIKVKVISTFFTFICKFKFLLKIPCKLPRNIVKLSS